MKNKYTEEAVYVVRPDMFIDYPNGFTYKTSFSYETYEDKGKFVPRDLAEGNHDFQQIIPYVIVRCKDKFLAYKRLEGSGEPRLYNTYSLGFGGHINTTDGYISPIRNGLYRELQEELHFKALRPPVCIGLVRDINSSTCEHTGFVFLLDVEQAQVRETNELDEKWFTKETLEKDFLYFESWSKYIIDWLVKNQLWGEVENNEKPY